MPLTGSVDSLVAAIRDDVAAEVERVEKTAADEIAARRADVDGVPAAAADRDQRLAAARRRNAESLAQAEWEARRAFIEQREQWIESVIARGREILKSMPADAWTAEALATAGDPHAEVIGEGIVRAGNLIVDNSSGERTRRFEPAWRAAIAGMYRP